MLISVILIAYKRLCLQTRYRKWVVLKHTTCHQQDTTSHNKTQPVLNQSQQKMPNFLTCLLSSNKIQGQKFVKFGHESYALAYMNKIKVNTLTWLTFAKIISRNMLM